MAGYNVIQTTAGNGDILATGIEALEKLYGLLEELGDADIATITLGENMPIEAEINTGHDIVRYRWNRLLWAVA